MKIKKRYCTQCSQAKENFPTILKKQKRICVECYTKLYGSIADMEAQRKATHENKRRNRKTRNRNIIINKLKQGCLECGETNYLCLEFVDEENRVKETEEFFSRNYTVKGLNEKISTYKILCCNCISLKLYEKTQEEILNLH